MALVLLHTSMQLKWLQVTDFQSKKNLVALVTKARSKQSKVILGTTLLCGF